MEKGYILIFVYILRISDLSGVWTLNADTWTLTTTKVPPAEHSEEIEDSCQNITCKAGRECRVLSTGIPECVCLSSCPRNKGRPICGSDGLLYKSHCDLHRQACLKGSHIRPNFHDHTCHEDPLTKLKKEVDQAMESIKQEEMKHIIVPRSCRQNHRNRMREYLVSWMALTVNKQGWYKKGMTDQEIVAHHFDHSDSNQDGELDSREWLGYLRQEDPNLKRDRSTRMLRKLCIEALIEEGDRNQDWRLTQNEFSTLMNQDYEPSYKYCVRDHKFYEDGTRTKVDCNGCICSCGKWICTSFPCIDETATTTTENYNQYEDMDNQID